jgi:predicted amidophosphoribosyltransferase
MPIVETCHHCGRPWPELGLCPDCEEAEDEHRERCQMCGTPWEDGTYCPPCEEIADEHRDD